ncbi:MAG TPA: fructosamine kinase family protein [Polyangiaceae bacterium]|nr:fructosamine kinase family protein [Polyangiaceae bacterium]
MRPELESSLQRRLGVHHLRATAISGGDINDAFRIDCAKGTLFVKANARAPRGLFEAEARGLAWLSEASALRIPNVVAVSDPDEPVSYLVLEYIEPGRPARDFDQALARGLAKLHRAGGERLGLDHDNFIGSLPQSNAAAPSWAEFYVSRRLAPLLERAAATGKASYAMRRGFERLFSVLPGLVGPEEPPSRLHGDLWSGNLHVAEDGAPCLIDPAVYAGHREMDLAMMRLFGGFSERVFSAYHEAHPLASGVEERVALYQLYPLMVHVNLFGGSYVTSVERALSRYV